ncbi:MICOS complex subunit MIC13 homolog QIL1 [Chelonus insularis]|uniref:MICOS complex subunit MIC13 homolog QIL1 n=1 Tax=Chelonus insularis TaxID=460826 RepID=UPI00158C9D81|nr:MICOS complex subunit MIC13 homolog QIL1 [Chelonus insularis]XP_034942627.1 MICOS complex subunit MIC13 homolog QIL1 [Chelonus insularis]
MGIIKFAIKSSLAGGIVYYTAQEGLWSDADHSIKFYNKLYTGIAPYVKEQMPKEVMDELPELPSVNNMSQCAGAMWNNGVKSTFKVLVDLPSYVSSGIESIKGSLENLNEKPKTIPDKKE